MIIVILRHVKKGVEIGQFNKDGLRDLTTNVDLSPIPKSELCPICFTEGSSQIYICFDGNFQMTTLGTTLEKRTLVEQQDLKDKRLFHEALLVERVKVKNY